MVPSAVEDQQYIVLPIQIVTYSLQTSYGSWKVD